MCVGCRYTDRSHTSQAYLQGRHLDAAGGLNRAIVRRPEMGRLHSVGKSNSTAKVTRLPTPEPERFILRTVRVHMHEWYIKEVTPTSRVLAFLAPDGIEWEFPMRNDEAASCSDALAEPSSA